MKLSTLKTAVKVAIKTKETWDAMPDDVKQKVYDAKEKTKTILKNKTVEKLDHAIENIGAIRDKIEPRKPKKSEIDETIKNVEASIHSVIDHTAEKADQVISSAEQANSRMNQDNVESAKQERNYYAQMAIFAVIAAVGYFLVKFVF